MSGPTPLAADPQGLAGEERGQAVDMQDVILVPGRVRARSDRVVADRADRVAVVVALDTERPASIASIASCKSRRVGSGRDFPKSVYQSSMRPR